MLIMLHTLLSKANQIETDTAALETMHDEFERACEGLEVDPMVDYITQAGPSLTAKTLAQKFNITESKADTIIRYMAIMTRTAPAIFQGMSELESP